MNISTIEVHKHDETQQKTENTEKHTQNTKENNMNIFTQKEPGPSNL
jgi:hypothetical protein